MANEATNVQENGSNLAVNRAKQWQIALFPFNNAATNVYFAFYTYFTYFALMYLTGKAGLAIGGTIVSSALALGISTFNGLFAPLMRVFDGITDPFCGSLMDRTKTRFGKFRPFMIIGNIMLAFSLLLMMVFFRGLPDDVGWLRWVIYILSYVIYVLGYTAQCACTKAGQTCLTNDPKQRSQFVIWNMIGMIGSIVLVNVMAGGVLTNEAICPKGLLIYEVTSDKVTIASSFKDQIQYSVFSADGLVYSLGDKIVGLKKLNETLGLSATEITQIPLVSITAQLADKGVNIASFGLDATKTYTYLYGAAYGDQFYNIMVPFVIVISAIYTAMAVAAIAGKDKPEFWGVTEKPAKLKDYVGILKGNKEIRWLVLSAGLNKLASTVATSGTVAFLLYGCLMGDYNGLFIPIYALCFVFMGIFFFWGSKTAGAKGQKRGVAQFTIFAFLFYIGLVVLLAFFNHDDPATMLSIYSMEGGFHLTINFYTILFIILYGCGYGAFNCCDNLTIPMVADCTDYETYRSGNYVPGIMGTIFSLIDKLISSLQQLLLLLFIVYLVPGLNGLPTEATPYMEGMHLSAIICFCLLPMAAWLITTFCMTRYSLSGKRLQEVQAVNSVRKAAVLGGMSMEQAMETWQTIDQVPSIFVHHKAPKIDKKTGQVVEEKENFLDKIYNKIFTRREQVTAEPSVNAIDIPEEYRTDEVKAMMGVAVESAPTEDVIDIVESDQVNEEVSEEINEEVNEEVSEEVNEEVSEEDNE